MSASVATGHQQVMAVAKLVFAEDGGKDGSGRNNFGGYPYSYSNNNYQDYESSSSYDSWGGRNRRQAAGESDRKSSTSAERSNEPSDIFLSSVKVERNENEEYPHIERGKCYNTKTNEKLKALAAGIVSVCQFPTTCQLKLAAVSSCRHVCQSGKRPRNVQKSDESHVCHAGRG